ncbi:MAG: hypothetical protein ACREK9_21940 [Candidatus Rokuibacteriota bacterium]
MSRRLLLLNVTLGLLGCFLAAALTRELLAARPLPAPPGPREARPAAVAASTASSPAPDSYGVIIAKNLFNPSRSEAPAGPAAAVGPKPLLHGVVMDGPKSRAYLEDPQLKRTFGYAVGDTVGGGRLESIGVDRVVIGRADGLLEVLLKDPSKPKAPVPAAPGPPAAEARAPGAPLPVPPPSRVPKPGARASER